MVIFYSCVVSKYIAEMPARPVGAVRGRGGGVILQVLLQRQVAPSLS